MIQRAVPKTLKAIAGCLLLTMSPPLAAQELPSFKVGNAPLVSVSAAQTYYNNKTIPAGIYDPGTSRAAELRDLARALKHDPDLIYAYVHDRIRFVPQYGLQKGALGTHIDEAGTAFDQAQLMVELLRESGFTTTYVFGTLNLNGSEFNDWIGVTDARAACEILADGGIPASVNSASSCGSVSGNVSSVTMAHVWVSVTISGQTVQFDPSYKTHSEIAPRIGNLATAMGYGGQAGFLSLAGGTTGSIAGAPTLRGINNTAINTELDRLAGNLITEIRSSANYDASLDELIGSRDIVPTTETSQRLTSLTNHTVTSSSLTEIPDAYRNILTLNIRSTTAVTFTETFFGDDIYGRRLTLDWVGTFDITGYHPNEAHLRLDDVTIGQFGLLQYNAEGRKIEYVLDHNYAANGGSYMDRTYQRYTGGVSQPVSFVIGFGPVSDRMMAKLTGERVNDSLHAMAPICQGESFPVELPSDPNFQTTKRTEITNTQVAYGWLAQLSRSVDLHAQIHDSVIQHHHSIGAVLSTTKWANLCLSVPNSPDTIFFPRDKAMQIDVITGVSVNEETGDAVLSRATSNSIALAASTLEGSVFEQFATNPDPASVTERFEWFNTERTTHNFHIVDSASVSAVQAALPVDDPLSGLIWTEDYANAGYLIIAPQRGDLGPGALKGPAVPGTQLYGTSYERGHAFYAIKPDGSDIAHIVFTGGGLAKGGGASDSPDDGADFDPDKVADILRDRFEDRSRLHGVDLATGDIAYSPPPDISTGSGDFPYSLAFQRSFAATGGRSRGMGVGWRHNWDITASYSGSATEAMGKTKALRAVPSLVAMLVAQDIIAGRSTNLNDDADSLKRLLTPVFVSHWWREHLHHNVVTVQQGAISTQFVRLPNGDFDPPPASNAELLQTGTPYAGNPAPPHSCDGPTVTAGACKRVYHYDNVTFDLRSADGDVIHIDGNKGATVTGIHGNPNVPQFWATRWTFPDGIELKFEYSSDEHAQLTRVVSNLGGSTSTFTGPEISFNWQQEDLLSINAKGASAAVTFTYADIGNVDGTLPPPDGFGYPVRSTSRPVLASVSNSASELTSYRYVGNGINTGQYDTALNRNDWFPRLHEVYLPLDGDPVVDPQVKPSLRFTYDHSWRAKAFADAVEIEDGSRGTWDFHVVPGYRGERIAPSVDNGQGVMVRPSYSVNYDEESRPVLFVDERGKPYTAEYDGLGRVKTRTMPEGNQVKFIYDTYHNVTELRQIAKGSPPPPADIVVTGAYGDSNWPTKPTAVTDANGNTTDIAYHAPSTLGAGNVNTVTQPLVDGGRPVYAYTYNAFGQLATTTDPEGMVTRNTYDTAGHLDTVIVDDGGFNLTTLYDFDLQGNQTLMNGPRTDVVDTTTQTWDAVRRPLITTDALNRKVENEYDANGQLIREEQRDVDNSLLSVTETDYTATGQVESTYNEECFTGAGVRNTGLANCGRTQFTYDGMDRESVVTDPAGRKSKTLYDPASQVHKLIRAYQTTQTYGDSTSLQQDYATYTYTDNGQADTVKDANGNLTTYEFDEHDRLKKTVFPHPTNTGTSNSSDYEQYEYDSNGNLLGKRTRKGNWILNAYDPLNRQVRKLLPTPDTFSGIGTGCTTSANDTCYKYDLVGRQEQVRFGDSSYVIDYVYDTAGRLSSATDDGRTIGYDYDEASNRDEIVWPDGYSAHYYYDALNRLDTIRENSAGGPLLADYDYDNRSRRWTLQFGNNLTTTYTYFPDSALNTLEHNLTGTSNDVLFTFGFNKANQVTSINLTNSTYEYGSSASRLSSYVPDGLNRYDSVTVDGVAVSPTYDLNGSLTSDGTWTYTYDIENRLRTAVGPGVSATYDYDPLGRRAGKSGSGVPTEVYLVDGDTEIADYDGSGNLLRRYVHGPGIDDPVVVYTGSGTSNKAYYHADWRGSIVALSDSSGALSDRFTYSSFGEVDDPTGNPFRFTGRRIDAETGLYYYRARYYSPMLGRFLQTDPIGYEDQMNLYTYVGNDPVNATDPSGKAACPNCWAAVIGGAVGVVGGAIGSAAAQLTDPDTEFSVTRVIVDSAKGGAVGFMGGLTLNPNVALATAFTLGATDGAVTESLEPDSTGMSIAGAAALGGAKDAGTLYAGGKIGASATETLGIVDDTATTFADEIASVFFGTLTQGIANNIDHVPLHPNAGSTNLPQVPPAPEDWLRRPDSR